MKDGKEVNAVMLVGRLFHARATVTRNDRSPMVHVVDFVNVNHSRSFRCLFEYRMLFCAVFDLSENGLWIIHQAPVYHVTTISPGTNRQRD